MKAVSYRIFPGRKNGKLAAHRLDQLRKAELVYTRRLHVVLPCLAFGTPVVFPSNEFRDLFDKSRLGLLHDIGFLYGEAVEMDVTPLADRFVRFVENALNTPIRPVDHPIMPIPIMPPDSGQHDRIQPATEAKPVKSSPNTPLQMQTLTATLSRCSLGASSLERGIPSQDGVGGHPSAVQPLTRSGRAQPMVSAVVLSRNGAGRIERCLESIATSGLVSEIVVCVDKMTTDATASIAGSFTPHVHLLETRGYIEPSSPW